MPKIVFACVDDWIGMYVDGDLKYQGHSVPEEQILMGVGIPDEDISFRNAVIEGDGGRFPDSLDEVTWEE